MTVRLHTSRADVGGNLPVFERLAPAPTPALLAARIEAHTGPGDVVVDLAGRGGWVARAAVDRQRRAVSIESSPLTRMLAEVVLRPPDVRHLDAAFQGMSASPRGESSLKVSMGDLFSTRCSTCGRVLVADEFTWSNEGDGPPRPITRHYRCTVCRDMRGGTEARHGELEPDDLARAMNDTEGATARAWARDRFPVVDGAPDLVDELLGLHTPRQLVALTAIMDRIEADLRAAPVLAALRLALLHTLIPSSRLATGAGRGGALARRRRPRPTAGRDAVARAQPVAGVRGRVPHRPRLRPASRGRCAGSAPGAPGRGPAGAGGGIRDRRPDDRQPVRGPCTQRRRRLRQGTPGPRRPSVSSSANRRCVRAWTASPSPITGRHGPWVARPLPCFRSTR